jgi:hypothetical protein
MVLEGRRLLVTENKNEQEEENMDVCALNGAVYLLLMD